MTRSILRFALMPVFALAACAHAPPRPAAMAAACPAASDAVPADDLFLATLWQQHAAEYDALSLQVYARAGQSLRRALADPGWQALLPSESVAPAVAAPVAVIADIDETLLDNSAFNVRQIRAPIAPCLTPDQARAEWDRRWREWVEEAQAPALPGAAEFMQQARRDGVAVFYVTNRKDEERAATCRNLLAAGFPVDDCVGQVLTRNEAEGRGRDKVSRRQQVAATHRVAQLFGDNLGDFAGAVFDSSRQRDALVDDRRGWWGERWFMLPNPGYGSWEEILGRIAPTTPAFTTAAARRAHVRALKEAALQDCRQQDCLLP